MRTLHTLLMLAVLSLSLLATVNCQKDDAKEQSREEEPERKHRTRRQREASMDNLRQMCIGMMMYANDFDDWLPSKAPGAEAFVQLAEYLPDRALLLSPRDRQHRPARPDAPITDANTSYLYLGIPDMNRPHRLTAIRDIASTPIVVEKPGLDDRYLQALFVDGHTQELKGNFTSLAELMEAIIEVAGEDMDSELPTLLREQAERIDADRAKYAY